MWVVQLHKRSANGTTTLKRLSDRQMQPDVQPAEPNEQTVLLTERAVQQQPPPSWLTSVVLLAVVSQICSIDRMAMSVAILPMSEQYNWANTVKGAVNGAFNIGYTITNLLGGYLAAAYGAKRVLALGVIIWSGFTVLTPIAAATGQLWFLLLVRAVMGVGEGVAFPCVQVLVKTGVPADKRSRSLSLIYSGHQLGSIISLLASPSIISTFGWPWVFYLYGSLGFMWLVVWQQLVFPVPVKQLSALTAASGISSVDNELQDGVDQKQNGYCRKEDISRYAADAPDNVCKVAASEQPVAWQEVPWKQFLQHPACWALLIAHCSFGVCYNVANSWLPAYYNSQFGVDVRQSAHMSILPFAVMAVTTNLSGWAADGLINSKSMSTTHTRKSMQSIGASVPAACLMYLASKQKDSSISTALALLSLMLAGLGFQAGGFASNHQDICTKYAGILFGVTNAGSSFAGSVAVYGVGVTLDQTHGSWGAVFWTVAWVQLLSWFVYSIWATSIPLFE